MSLFLPAFPDAGGLLFVAIYADFIMAVNNTGIRPSEALSLQDKHFDFKRLLITITAETSKTKEERILPISPLTAEAIRKLIASRHPEWNKDTPVFL